MAVKKSARKPKPKSIGRWATRPPIVAVLGHVDHGKTTLISKIHQIDLTKKESGGISQHIGAYQINYAGKKLTLIDTPGHVAFSKMRSRGAKVADLVVLVVAADEGVMPQTLESLKHIQEAKIPYLVAINKIDLPGINLEKVKENLAKNNILVEGYGGDIVVVSVSAKTGQGIDDLLEMILLLGEMSGLKANPQGRLEAVVVESKLDQRRGPVATIVIREGSLKTGEKIAVGEVKAKIKALYDENGKSIKLANPGQAVAMLGFAKVLPVGAKVKREISSVALKQKIEKKPTTPEEEEKKLRIILKADVLGTLEAILGSLSADVSVIHCETGDINKSDVLLASSTRAEIIGFRVKTSSLIQKLAEAEGVKIKSYEIIYDLLDEIEKKVLRIIEPTIDEQILGRAEILAEFEIKDQRIAGCKVKEGQFVKQNNIHLKRGKKVIGDCRIRSLKIGKNDVEKVKEGEEFGAVLSPSLDFEVGDMLISFHKVEE